MFKQLFNVGNDADFSVMSGNNTGCDNSSSACNGLNRGCTNHGTSCNGATNYKYSGTSCGNLSS